MCNVAILKAGCLSKFQVKDKLFFSIIPPLSNIMALLYVHLVMVFFQVSKVKQLKIKITIRWGSLWTKYSHKSFISVF